MPPFVSATWLWHDADVHVPQHPCRNRGFGSALCLAFAFPVPLFLQSFREANMWRYQANRGAVDWQEWINLTLELTWLELLNSKQKNTCLFKSQKFAAPHRKCGLKSGPRETAGVAPRMWKTDQHTLNQFVVSSVLALLGGNPIQGSYNPLAAQFALLTTLPGRVKMTEVRAEVALEATQMCSQQSCSSQVSSAIRLLVKTDGLPAPPPTDMT